jgi:hypothetical protein
MSSCEILALTSSRPNFEVLVAHVVLAHPHMTFYYCTCRLYRDDAAIVATLISYSDVKVADETITKRRLS